MSTESPSRGPEGPNGSQGNGREGPAEMLGSPTPDVEESVGRGLAGDDAPACCESQASEELPCCEPLTVEDLSGAGLLDPADAPDEEPRNPMEDFLRMDRIPHIWCSGCGIGVVVTSFADALRKSALDLDKVAVVSGIGCTGRVAGYVKLDSFHTTHGRAIPFATGLKLANPELQVVVFSGDGDITGIGGNHFIHAARRNMDLLVICVNNFNYAMTGGQVAATSPIDANLSTAPFGNFEYPFNLPYLAEACGATYVARWTCLHIRRVTYSIQEALGKRGFRFIEVIAPCVTVYARRNRLGDGLDLLKYYYDESEIRHDADTRTVAIDYQGRIVCGKFVDREKPPFLDCMNAHLGAKLGDKYVPYGVKP